MSSLFASYWFTDSRKPHWRPTRTKDYNQRFLNQLRQLDQIYQLTRKRFGFSTSDFLREVFVRNHVAYARLAQLDWGGYLKHSPGHITLQFKLDLELYLPIDSISPTAENAPKNLVSGAEYANVMALPFIIQFKEDYPLSKPRFILNRDQLRSRGMGVPDFKWDQITYLCVMNDSQDWVVGSNNNMVTAVDCLVDWMADNYFYPIVRFRGAQHA